MAEEDKWFKRTEYSWLQRFFIKCVTSGRLPTHVAFIMDGNRRYAKANSISRAESYAMGFEKIGEILDYCETFHIKIVSAYAFSIENFKRSEEEQKELFTLMWDKTRHLLTRLDKLQEKGIRVKVSGDTTLFPSHITQTLAELEVKTAGNSEFCLNLCLGYTSRDEMTHAVQCMTEGVVAGRLRVTDITEDLFEKCLYTEELPPVDMLVRTSGVVRLSDYMMWQANFAALQFVKVCWPDFGFWHFVGALLDYQRQDGVLRVYRETYQPFLERMTHAEQAAVGHTEHCTLASHEGCVCNEEVTQASLVGSERRKGDFVEHLRTQRRDKLETLAVREVLVEGG